VLEKIKTTTRRFTPVYRFMKNKFCCKTDINMQFYSKHEDRIKNRLDILNYIQFSNRLDILSSLIQSKVQNLCLKNMSKMGNLSDEYITF